MKLVLLTHLLLFSSCSLWKTVTSKEKIYLTTLPEEAKVYSHTGELLGTTPLQLDNDLVEKNKSGEFIPLTISKEGYLDTQWVVNLKDLTKANMRLVKLNSNHFQKWVFSRYGNEINDYTKDLLSIQLLILSSRYDEARQKLMPFQDKYPNIAAIFTMLAQVEIQDKKFDKAKTYLEKAVKLDEKDTTAIRMLNLIQSKIENGKNL